MIAGLSTDIRPLIGEAVARGGNIRVGLDDAPFRSPMSNLEWVEAGTRLGSRRATGARVDCRRRLTTYFCLLRTGCPQSGSPAALFAHAVQAVLLFFYPVTAQRDPRLADSGPVLIDASAVDDR
jgi:hypothetical protein